jgi:dTMP kinase
MHKAHARSAPFVVLEGIDGAGTTTQTRLLVEALRARNIPALETREPSDGPVGMLLRQMLKGRIVAASGRGAPGWEQLGLLFAADRLDHVEAEVRPRPWPRDAG